MVHTGVTDAWLKARPEPPGSGRGNSARILLGSAPDSYSLSGCLQIAYKPYSACPAPFGLTTTVSGSSLVGPSRLGGL
jgi:hypothetical protein